MDSDDEQLLLGGGPGPELVFYDIEDERWVTPTMGNGINREGDGSSSSGSDTVTPPQAPQPVLPGRRCFVTVGATAGFTALLEEVSTPDFLRCLGEHGYRFLDVQCGPDFALFHQRISNLSDEEKGGVSVQYFGYTPDILGYILSCRGEENVRPAGCVISHGGTGTVGEVLAVGAPLIVVANPTLMDNHQLELAQGLEDQNQAIHGHIGSLAFAIHRMAVRISEGTLDALPPYSPPPFPVAAADRITLFDWMVLTCYPEELAVQMHLADLRSASVEFAHEQQQQQQQQMVNGNSPTVATSNQGDNVLPQLD